ncbi:glutamate--tRNA ligase [Spiroplasma endosymbiont of Thecophora atra]|uniref:glutamate--tRNA ligase n=1 Tax=Spiroplasma endosymbiont of Thecophora atra TaxID=3066294 RepID=UPI0030CE0FB5
MKIRVRYAPSPTGYLHIGGARTALFNYLFAKNNKGDFIVRIEDTDLERNIEDGISSQLDNLRWMGIIPDETIDLPGKYGPYKQTERLNIYIQHALILIKEKKAYYCFCTPQYLEEMRKKQADKNILAFQYDGTCSKLEQSVIEENLQNKISYAIRVKITTNKSYKIKDLVRGNVEFNSVDLGDYIIIKSNGVATYNFAVVIDDHLMEISHVFRGEEHLSNTPKQLVIYEYFNWKMPIFAHLTLIVNNKRKKLSKRDGSIIQFIHQYRKEGYLPEAIFNFIALLGWSSHEEKEIYTKEQLIKLFTPKYLSKAPSMFDPEKLVWMNNYYIKRLNVEQYLALVTPFIKEKYNWNSKTIEWWKEVLLIYQSQLEYGSQINELVSLFFKNNFKVNIEAKTFLNDNECNLVCTTFIKKIIDCKNWTSDNIKNIINEVKKETNVNGKLLFMPIRIITTGQMHGPDLVSTIKLLGYATIINNVKLNFKY